MSHGKGWGFGGSGLGVTVQGLGTELGCAEESLRVWYLGVEGLEEGC